MIFLVDLSKRKEKQQNDLRLVFPKGISFLESTSLLKKSSSERIESGSPFTFEVRRTLEQRTHTRRACCGNSFSANLFVGIII